MTTTSKPPLTTGSFAAVIGRSPQTVRSEHCRTGQAYGITPIKIKGRLLWPADQVESLLTNAVRANTQSEGA